MSAQKSFGVPAFQAFYFRCVIDLVFDGYLKMIFSVLDARLACPASNMARAKPYSQNSSANVRDAVNVFVRQQASR